MNVKNNEKGNIALVGVAIVAGLIIGFAVGKAMNNNKTVNSTGNNAAVSSTTKAADLRANLVTLGLQHQTLTNAAVDAALDGSKTADASAAALYANGNDIGAAVGSVYGKDAETTFDAVWKVHLDQFVKYAVADSTGDTAGKQAALDTISTKYTKPLAAYLAKANPNLPEATLESVLSDHVQMTATMIDDHVQGKYADEQSELKQADQHIEGIFSTLAGAIVKQYPSKFAE